MSFLTSFLLFSLVLSAPDDGELSPAINANELKAHVYRFASPEFEGRRGAGAARASKHTADMFQKIGLQPAFGESFFQPIPWRFKTDEGIANGNNGFAGRNVVGFIPGSDPLLKDEWIILSAHFDHLGKKGGEIYPGADDNASGMAMLLEVAEKMALQDKKPRRTVVFAAFDQEEYGLLGSRHFCQEPPRELKKLKAFMTADMIGRSMRGLTDEYLFVLGCETSSHLKELVMNVKPTNGLSVGRLGADIVGTRSDYGPFRDKEIPFLFFTTGEDADYHKTTDLPDRINYVKLHRISNYVADVCERLANDEKTPVWQKARHDEKDLEEATLLRTLLDRVAERAAQLRLGKVHIESVASARNRLTEIIQRGKITLNERTWLVGMCRFMMIALGG